jgi:tetratricopeptide (TPR) repeat protein
VSAPDARTPSSPAAAAQLQAEGHQLLGQARYSGAVSHLRAALAASGQSLNRCAEPASQACLTYAYALYDLGRALRLDGHPTAAVPVLTERLQIDNQRPTVQYELGLAREQLHSVPSTPPPGSPTHP